MGKRLPSLKARQIIRVLEHFGFHAIRQSGSHVFFKHPDGRNTVVTRHSGEDIGRGLLREILREAEISPTEFIDSL